jgi:hypothetical protein
LLARRGSARICDVRTGVPSPSIDPDTPGRASFENSVLPSTVSLRGSARIPRLMHFLCLGYDVLRRQARGTGPQFVTHQT